MGRDYTTVVITPNFLYQTRSQQNALFHLEEGQTDTPINHADLGVGPNRPSPTVPFLFISSVRKIIF